MSSKRKQLHGDTATGVFPHMPSKKIKTDLQSTAEVGSNAAHKRKRPTEDTAADATTNTSAKKAKLGPKTSSTVLKKPVTARTKTTVTTISTPKSTLVPRGDRKKAKLGEHDESVLRMVCDCTLSGKVTELHFRKIPHSMIDWNNSCHISKINAWRNQIYGRAGLKAKSVTMWHELEELWFELYLQLSIAESRKHGILLPTTKVVREAFNETFHDKVLQDKDGDDLEPRVERQPNAFASKFNRMCPLLRARLNHCVFGKSGDVFIPEIDFKMLERYKAMKDVMAAKGIKDESSYAEELAEWQHFLSHIPNATDADMEDTNEEEETKEMEAKEGDAAAALISLAHSPVNAKESVSLAVAHNNEVEAERMTPELTRSCRTSFSQASDGPHTPIQQATCFASLDAGTRGDDGSSSPANTGVVVDPIAQGPYFKTYNVSTEDHFVDSELA